MVGNNKEIAEWLRGQAADRLKQARCRRESASAMRNASPDDLIAAKRVAEKMSGRKLAISTSIKSVGLSVGLDERIALNLETEAEKLNGWAAFLENSN